jgi:hypothetical protein
LLFVCVTLLVLTDVARGDGTYQPTRNGRTLVWNNHPKPGDVATWSGGRDREGYARGFGSLTWYTKEIGSAKRALYARYWGRMIRGKFNGPVNVHSKKKTHYAIFDDGVRTTRWSTGTAPSGATARWRAIVAKRRIVSEPEAPAEGPSSGRLEMEDGRSEPRESIQDLRRERWPMIDIDDSLRLLALPPRSLRRK